MADQSTRGRPPIPSQVFTRNNGGRWTREEELFIINGLESTSTPLTFQEISAAMPYRSAITCQRRYELIRARQLSADDLQTLQHLWELLVIPIARFCSRKYSWLTRSIAVTATRCFFHMPARAALLLVNLRESRVVLVLESGKKAWRAWMCRLSEATI